MSADRIEIYRDNAGLWRFRRRARNGEIGNPSQPYARRWNALVGAARWNPICWEEALLRLRPFGPNPWWPPRPLWPHSTPGRAGKSFP